MAFAWLKLPLRAAARLLDACDRGDVVIVVLPPVLAECVFVLESFYGHARADVASVLARLISSPGIEIKELVIHLDALNRYKRTRTHFVDCLIAATAVAENMRPALPAPRPRCYFRS
jgi:predicted nucleic-acid-binding protein